LEFPPAALSAEGVGHAFIARDAAQDAVAWIAARFGGNSSPDDCGRTL
jgi:hypothetical protein